MGIILIILEAVATFLLLMALVMSAIWQWMPRGWRVLRTSLAIMVVLAGCVPWVTIGVLAFWARIVTSAFAPAFTMQTVVLMSAAVIAVVGAIWVAVYGARSPRMQPGVARAGTWAKGRLASVWLAAAAVLCITVWNVDLDVRQEMTMARLQAGSTALAFAPPRLPDSQNAALIYEQVIEILDADPVLGSKWPGQVMNWITPLDGNGKELRFDPAKAEMLAFLQRQRGAVRLVHQAAAMPGCNFEHNYASMGVDVLLPELSKERNLGRLLVLSARVNAQRHQMVDAMTDVNAVFALGSHAANDPLLISALVGMAIDKMAADALADILSRQDVPAEALDRLHIDPRWSFARAMLRSYELEESAVIASLTDMAVRDDLGRMCVLMAGSEPHGPHGLDRLASRFFWMFYLRDDIGYYRQAIGEQRRLMAQPYHIAHKELRIESRQHVLRGFLAKIILPSLNMAAEAAAKADAAHRMALTAVAMRRYAIGQGQMPGELAKLVPDWMPALPIDPFTGQPIKLVTRPDGSLVLYSIGPDMKDDGGQTFDDKSRKGDLVFVLKH